MAAPVGVEALKTARNFLQSVRFVPLASREVVRASAVGAGYHLSKKARSHGRHYNCHTFMYNEGNKDNQR